MTDNQYPVGWVGKLLLRQVAEKRPPDVIIGSVEDPYLLRWHVIPRNPLFNIYLHHFKRSDDDRALHSHPWIVNASWLLKGHYLEHLPNKQFDCRIQGEFVARVGPAFHRVELRWGDCYTLFITGPKIRTWGFACPKGFVPWQAFTKVTPGATGIVAETGAGCGEP
jgi:hypothetical protein